MNRCVLVLNCGSSSIKLAIIDAESGETLLSGLAERLNNPEAELTIKQDGNKQPIKLAENSDHKIALQVIGEHLSQFCLLYTSDAADD